MRTTILSSLVAVSSMFAVEDDGKITVRDISIEPMAELTLLDGIFEYHPYFFTELSNDNNVYKASNKDSDTFYEAAIGVQGLYWLTEKQRLYIDTELSIRDYSDENLLDINCWHAKLRLLSQADSWDGDFGFVSQRIFAPTEINNANVERFETSVDGKIDFEHYNGEMVFTMGYSRITYGNTALQARDRNLVSASLSYSKGEEYKVGGKIKMLGTIYDLNSGSYQNSTSLQFLGIWERFLTDDLKLDLEGGIDLRNYSDDFANTAAYDDQKTVAFSLDARLLLTINEKLNYDAKMITGICENDTSNYARVSTAGIGATYQITDSILSKANIDYNRLDSSGSATGVTKKTVDSWIANVEASYDIKKGMAATLGMNLTNQEADGAAIDFTSFNIDLNFVMAF